MTIDLKEQALIKKYLIDVNSEGDNSSEFVSAKMSQSELDAEFDHLDLTKY